MPDFDFREFIVTGMRDHPKMVRWGRDVQGVMAHILDTGEQPCFACHARVWKQGSDFLHGVVAFFDQRIMIVDAIRRDQNGMAQRSEVLARDIYNLRRLDPSDLANNPLMKTLSINNGWMEFSDGPPFDDGTRIFDAFRRYL